ncbi:hypothetical protein [Streptomyces sp. OK228]|uniref:hypothetical protein n=1 Tax=Streptomyces sp. OK228 TaxID=1882786 RepID=UPI000BD7BB5C|nr:hypothetical protein [Streptomyces sp. OK228]SOE31754.1 hypothetical protein SAMN05442782_8687 [Streptomyces sp. OK228]
MFTVGQQIRTLVDLAETEAYDTGDWEGEEGIEAPAGTLGVIQSLPDLTGYYGVLLHCDPDDVPAEYSADEIAAA